MKNMRILVLCGGKYAMPALQTLALEKYLCGIGIGKGEQNIAELLESESERTGLAFKSFPDKSSISSLYDWIAGIKPDYIFSISFPFLVPAEALSYGKEKFINFHPGPLPAYRGPMPLFEVLRYGESETAVSVHFMDEEFDEGPLIITEHIPIDNTDTYGSLAVTLSERTAQIAVNVAQMLDFASVIPSTQQQPGGHYFEKPEQEDTFIKWNRMPANEVLNLIRACNPWNQGADTILFGESVKLISASLSTATHNEIPGTILGYSEENGLLISCIGNQVIGVRIISSDRGICSASDFIDARKTTIGNQIKKNAAIFAQQLQDVDNKPFH